MHTSVCPASLLSLRNDFLLDLMLVLMGTRIPMLSNDLKHKFVLTIFVTFQVINLAIIAEFQSCWR